MSRTFLIALFLAAPAIGQETIGPWTIGSTPISATLIAGGGLNWCPLNVVPGPTTFHEAFTGFSIVDDGYANGGFGTTVQVVFANGALVNVPGPDLVMFDSRFSMNDYTFSSSHDGYGATVTRLAADFTFTGVTKNFYYQGGGPYLASVMACPIDLSDLGVAAGASVSGMRFIGASSNYDPLGMGVICQDPCTPTTQNYCVSSPNSTGNSALMFSTGSTSVAANDFVLHAAPVPNQPGLFFFGPTQVQAPFGNGFLCVGAPQVRFAPQAASNNQLTFAVDNTAVPAAGNLVAGSVWNFQCWYRDPGAGGALFSTSDGLEASFQP